VQSKDKLVKLPLKLSLKASHSKIRRGGVITFTGAGLPAHPGSQIELQKRDKNGYFKTVARTTASVRSTYTSRLRLRRGGVFRALFPGDNQFGISASRPIRVTAVKSHKH
jgi:hypothetical protein